MRANEFLTEGKGHPVIVVDVQPAYDNDVNEDIIEFVNNQTGPVLMFVNAEETGITEDTMQDVQQYWDDKICGYESEEDLYEEDEYGDYVEKECDGMDWNRVELVDKGYGYLREAMDNDVPDNMMIKVIREMYQQKVTDSRSLFNEDEEEFTEWFTSNGGDIDDAGIILNGLSVEWTSVGQLKRFSGAYIVGGGRNECLREVELLMNAFNIKYKRIDSLVYG